MGLGVSNTKSGSQEAPEPMVSGAFGALERTGLEHICFLETGSGELLCGHQWQP